MDSKTEEFLKDIYKPVFPTDSIEKRIEQIENIKEEIERCLNQKTGVQYDRCYTIPDSLMLSQLKEILKKYNLYGVREGNENSEI